jgi:hypothetical protein
MTLENISITIEEVQIDEGGKVTFGYKKDFNTKNVRSFLPLGENSKLIYPIPELERLAHMLLKAKALSEDDIKILKEKGINVGEIPQTTG